MNSGERPFALVVKDADQVGGDQATDIKACLQPFAARGVTSKYGIPEKIQFIDGLAKTSVGKIDKKLLRETYAHIAQRQPLDDRQDERRVQSRHNAAQIIPAELNFTCHAPRKCGACTKH